MVDVRETVTRKIGPLPLYAWVGILVAGVFIARKLTGGGGGSTVGGVVDAASGIADTGTGGSGGTTGGTAQPPITVPGSTGGNGKIVLRVSKLVNIFSSMTGTHTGSLTSGTYYVQKVISGGKTWWKITGSPTNPKSTMIGKYIPGPTSSAYTVTTTTAA